MKINDWVLPLRKRKVAVEVILVRFHTHIFEKNKIGFKLGSACSFFNYKHDIEIKRIISLLWQLVKQRK